MNYEKARKRLQGAYVNKDHRDRGIRRGELWDRSEAPNRANLLEMVAHPDGRSWNRRKSISEAERVFVLHYCGDMEAVPMDVAQRVVDEILIEEMMEE